MDFTSRLKAAEAVARKAGEMLVHHGKVRIFEKAANDFVTEMDMASEKLIRGELLSQFPEDGFFGEEGGGDTDCKGRWIVDPIDGTQSFMRGHAFYAVSIGYEYEGELVIGVVYIPYMDEMYTAVRGQGATMNGEPIHVSDTSDPKLAIAHLGYGHRVVEHRERMFKLLPDFLRAISDVRRTGCAAYALCCVAAGRSDLFFELGLHIYDFAAGAVILREAGGVITGWTKDEPFCETGHIVCSNTILHDFMLSHLEEK